MGDTPLLVAAPRMLLVRNRRALQNHLLDRADEGRRDLVVGFEQTHYIDSSGLGMLAGLHRALVRERGARLRLAGLNPELRLLFQVTRLDQTLELIDTVEGEPDPWRAPENWSAAASVLV